MDDAVFGAMPGFPSVVVAACNFADTISGSENDAKIVKLSLAANKAYVASGSAFGAVTPNNFVKCLSLYMQRVMFTIATVKNFENAVVGSERVGSTVGAVGDPPPNAESKVLAVI